MNEKTNTQTTRPKRVHFRNLFDVFLFSLGLFVIFRLNVYLAGNETLVNEAVFAGRETIFAIAIIVLFAATFVYFARRFQHYQLATKLIIAFVVVSLATALGISQIASRTVRSSLVQEVGTSFVTQTGSLRNQVNLYFHEKVSQLQALALVDTVKSTLELRNDSYEGSTEEIIEQIQQLDELWLTAADDDPLISRVVTPDEATNPVSYQLYDYLETFPAHTEIFVTDRYGATLASTGRLSDYYQADESWWQAAWNDGAGAIYISDPEFDDSAGITALLVALPIRDEDSGEILGIVRSTLAVDDLYALIGELRLGESGYAMLLDNDGTILYEPGASEAAVTSELSADLRRALISDEANFLIAPNEEGDETLFGHTLLHSEADLQSGVGELNASLTEAIHALGWAAVVRQDTSEAFAPVAVINKVIEVASVGAVALAAILGYLVAGFIVKPIQQLSLAVQAVGDGNLDAPLPTTGRDEVGSLVTNFGRMVGQLKTTLQNLQGRNRDLDLTIEIGRELTQTRELTETLNQAVETIRSRFDLYYTQIYLVDPSQRHLILRAGTGETGRLLVERGHRLVIGAGSLNGMAAARREPVIVADTNRSELHRPNPLLPETRSEMVIPLLAGEQLVGVLDLQSVETNRLSEDVVASFVALAGQLAIAIQNAALFSEVQQARAETEQYTRRLLNQGWQDFLNGVDRPQRLVTAYGLGDPLPLDEIAEKPADQEQLVVPLAVAGASIGQIRLQDNLTRKWTEQDNQILQAVADKMANQIENLRLLAEAEQYRRQTQEVSRRLTREHWQGYLTATEQRNLGFVYDQNQVVTATEDDLEVDLKRSLSVEGEIIGELMFSGLTTLNENEQIILQQVVNKASSRLWTLHLVEQTEQALTRTEGQAERLRQLNHLGNELSGTQTTNEAFAAVAGILDGIVRHDQLSVTLLDQDSQELEVFALDSNSGAVAVGTRLPVQGTAIGATVTQLRPMRIGNLHESAYLENKKLAEQGVLSTLIVPLVSGRRVLGTLNMASTKVDAFTEQDEALLMQVAPLLAARIESQRLFGEIREQARREQMLNNIGQKIRRTVTLESALQTAVHEMARAPGCTFCPASYVYRQTRDGRRKAAAATATAAASG